MTSWMDVLRVVAACLVLAACDGASEMREVRESARLLVQAESADAERAAATALAEKARQREVALTLTLRRPNGELIPFSAFAPGTAEPAVVEIAIQGADEPVHWRPRDPNNIYLLMRE